MPTYQYRCTSADCDNRFELVQAFTDPAATECPVCGQPVRKVYGSVGVVFKGSGFYRTDSRAAATAGASKNGDGAAGKSESGSAKSESGSAKSESGAGKSTGSSSSSGSGTPAKVAASA